MTAKSASDQKTAENRILQNFSYKTQAVGSTPTAPTETGLWQTGQCTGLLNRTMWVRCPPIPLTNALVVQRRGHRTPGTDRRLVGGDEGSSPSWCSDDL
jgi:hypothetical protein